MAYVLYCDESSDKDPKFGDFFGGCLIDSADLYEVETALNKKKRELNITGEIKWTKVTENYREKYQEIMKLFFSFVLSGKVKVRIMFRNIDDVPSDILQRKVETKYFKLYYQFIKHAFGFDVAPCLGNTQLIINLDVLPDNNGQRSQFKDFLCGLPTQWGNENIIVDPRNIIEVDSRDHILLQCTDIIMGAMYFRLNNFHLVKPEGKRTRGKKTIAKEKLYKYIYKQINEIHPNFNIGVSTGARKYEHPHWTSPYEHWKFIPK